MVILTKEIEGVIISEVDDDIRTELTLKTHEHRRHNKFFKTNLDRKQPARSTDYNGPKPSLEDYKQKRKEKQELKMVEEKLRKDEKALCNRRKIEREHRKQIKKENESKNMTVQVITDNKKIKKYSRKAKDKLMKMPKELFEKYLHGGKHSNK